MESLQDISAAQFENVNSLRSYPFGDGTELVSSDGKILPRDVVVDIHLTVPAQILKKNGSTAQSEGASFGIQTPIVRMKSVYLSPSMVSACFVSVFGSVKSAASVTVSRTNFAPYMPYRLEQLAGSIDIGGVVTFGDFDFPGFPEAYFLDAEVHPCCVSVSDPPRLRSFVDPRSGERLSGDVAMSFTGYVNAHRIGKSISLSLEKGASDELASDCAKITGADACGATPISSINGVRPDDEGNIVLWFH